MLDAGWLYLWRVLRRADADRMRLAPLEHRELPKVFAGPTKREHLVRAIIQSAHDVDLT